MLFGLKNAEATYQCLVNEVFRDKLGRNVEDYINDMIVKRKDSDNHLGDLKETLQNLRHHNMCLNPSKCAFGVQFCNFL